MDPLYLRKLRIDRQIQRQMQNLNNNDKNNSANGVNSGNTPAVTGEEVGNASEQMKNQANELVKNIRDEVMTPRREQKYNYIASMERSDYVKKMMNLPSTLPELLIQLQRPNSGKGIYNVLNYQIPKPDISQPQVPQQPVPPQVPQQPVPPQVPQQPVPPQVPQQPVPPQVPQQPVPPQVPQQPVPPQVPQQPVPPQVPQQPVPPQVPQQPVPPQVPQQPVPPQVPQQPVPPQVPQQTVPPQVPQQTVPPQVTQQPVPPQVPQQPVPPQVPQQPVPPQVPQQPVPPQVPQQPVPPQVPQQPVPPQVSHQPQPPHIGMKPDMRPPMHEPMPLPDNKPVPPNNNVIPPRTQYLEGNVELWSPKPTHINHQGPHNNNRPNIVQNFGPNNINRPQPMPMPNSPVVNMPPNQNAPNIRPEIRPEHLHNKPHVEHHPSEEVGAVKDSTIDDAQAMLYTQLSMNDVANPTLTQMKQRLTDDAFELLFTGMLNLNDLSETIKHNGKDARSKLILAMANASKQGIDNSQISGSLKMVSESMALEENNPASILKNIILLYLPWYPLQEGVGFKLAIDTMPNMSDFSSLLKVFIQTRNYGNVNGSLILMNANNVDMQIQCDDKFPKDDLLERMKEVTVNHTINSNITVEQRVQMEQEVQNQQAKVNLSSTYDLNPFLLLMAHSFIKNTIIIDGSANV